MKIPYWQQQQRWWWWWWWCIWQVKDTMSGNTASECVSCYPRWRPSHVPDPAETQSLRLHHQTTDQTKESVNNITTTSLLVVKKRKWDSITPTIRDNLHWRLVRQRIDFKICILVYRCLHQLVAPYLVSMISPVSTVSTRRHLRSAGQGDLVVPRTRTTGFGLRLTKLFSLCMVR